MAEGTESTQPTQFTIGTEATCSDGPCGKLSRVVVDPVARAVTDLVIDPEHRHATGRIVPLRLVASTAAGIRLSCTQAEFGQLDPAEETRFIPGGIGFPGYGPGLVLSWPYYGLGGMSIGGLAAGERADDGESISQVRTYDAVPLDEVSVRRGEHVRATDGLIGRVQGLVMDPRSHHVTHVLLQEGHLWGTREVAIPIGSVADVSDGVRLSITRQDVRDLPPVDIDHDGTGRAPA